MTTSNLSPHDRLFRTVFKVPEQARGLLQVLVPAELAARIDWSTLKLESATFIDEVSSRTADVSDGRSMTGAITFPRFEHDLATTLAPVA